MKSAILLMRGTSDSDLRSLQADNDSRYGAHLSAEEVHALVAPHPDTLELVESWLAYHDIDPLSTDRSGGNDWITLRVSVAQAERMLGRT
jgi:tripeptidyl-peptidase-1